ncbi:MAG: endonuclease/exonuclease/phosphatase family protein [Bacteroidales bacterium]|jgi:exonuclease III|nr:endonuclease/exonuclease/phosphatase family protein [Bacteroidales bacterium]
MKKIFKIFCIFALLFCSAQAWGQATEGEDWQQDDGLDNNYWKEEWGHIDKEEAEPGGGNTNITVIPDTITMMTYNVLHKNFQYDSNTYKYANVISGVSPDVLALQELIDREIFNNLKIFTGMDGEMFCTHYKNQGTGLKANGIGILWNPIFGTPIITTKKFPLWGEQVGYIVAEFGNFCFISTHYPVNMNGCDAAYRKKTTKKILNNKVVKRCKNSGKPVYIAGDFNEEPNNPNEAIQLFVNEGFEVLNDPTKVWSTEEGKEVYELTTGPNRNQIDLIIEYNIYPLHKTIVQSKPDDFSGGNPSDHKPYYVKVKIR